MGPNDEEEASKRSSELGLSLVAAILLLADNSRIARVNGATGEHLQS